MTREEAVEVLKERYLTCVGIGLDNHANRVNEAIDMAIEALQPKRTESKWIYHMTEGVVKTISCSQCSAWYDVTIPEQIATFNFCPNCGARMLNGGEQDGNV